MVQLSLPLKWVALAVYFRTISTSVLAFPQYQSLAGLSERELKEALPTLTPRLPTPPRPEVYQGAKLVDNAAHPWRAPRAGDQRGPCPGLNTLANHGYLPRDGVASPAQTIAASMAGFNMDLQGASIATYVGHLLDGNLVTDLVSIGGKTPKTGPDPPGNGLVSGIHTHGTFEGDASITRGTFCLESYPLTKSIHYDTG
ncbi:Cloroperoxidase [Coprinopsis marcescibilis]|uniref:Cloroperoxidase n=1 Tax=Coprinopsis marcescibilis TaxID=230819 RepID=A0A5C3KEL6_COPMA|nr:Cloroperoxidase [Coprinopsis marcescibilis]